MTTANILAQLDLDPSRDLPGTFSGQCGWLISPEMPRLEIHSPSNGVRIATLATTHPEHYERLLIESQVTFDAWRRIPAPKRGQAVRLIGEALRQYKDALGSLISLETGKIKAEGDGEVQEMIDMADFAVGQSRMLYGLTLHSERPEHRMYEQWHPLGIVGIATAFNFPVAVYAWNAFLALICGDVTVWKPSPKAVLSAVAVQKIVSHVLEANGFPQVSSLFTTTDNQLAERFYADSRIGLMSFTGSTAIGIRVAEIAAKRLGRCLLELGGNNAIIVDESADLDLAVPAIVFGAVGTAGQRCTSTRRLIVESSIADTLIDRLVRAYQQIKIGDPLDPKTLMGPLIDRGAVERYQAALQDLRSRGAQILYGGQVLDRPGHFVEPTLVRAEPTWPLIREETFAPILYILTYRDFDEAIAFHNSVPQGLSSAIFTRQIAHAEVFLSARGSDCGIANVNIGTSGAEIGGAFGGEKATGGGRESGSDAWKNYMRRQTNTINYSRELPLAQGIHFDLGSEKAKDR
ncbi:MAG: L-piperidine-6-carboxylate dehydrogenase [Gammaproteobacteria bacterium]